jgi:rubrerythrin
MFKIGEIIDLAIQIERNGEEIYRKAIELHSSPSVNMLLQKLADEELQHAEWFIMLKQKVAANSEDPKLEEMAKSILLEVLGNQAFSLQDVDFSKIRDTKDLLNFAIEFERDTIIFYNMIGSLIEDTKTQYQLEKIIEEENRHIQSFQKILDAGDFETRK